MKTRLQLQGELVKADANAPRVYNNVMDVFRKTWKNEGIRGLQRGLLPAYGYQILLNGSRLGECRTLSEDETGGRMQRGRAGRIAPPRSTLRS
jgi:hypothetical protein